MRLFYWFIIFTIFFSSKNVFVFAAPSSSNDCFLSAFLKVGSRGEEVKCLQGKIGVTTDGIFGPITRATVMVFQKNHGLAADGIIGPFSRTALNGVAANDNIYPAGCAGITGYSITTGVKCDIGAPMPLSPTVNNTPASVVNNNTQPSSKSSAGIINNTKNTNPNLVNLDRFIKTVVDVNRKNGSNEKDLKLMADALREQITSSKINYNEEFKKMLIREASLGFDKKPFWIVFDKVFAKTFSFLGIVPLVAKAATIGIPFGGALLYADFCAFSINFMIVLITPLPPSFVQLLSYFPGTQGFATHNIPFTSNLLGTYVPSGACVLSKEILIPTEGTITPMVGSSPL